MAPQAGASYLWCSQKFGGFVKKYSFFVLLMLPLVTAGSGFKNAREHTHKHTHTHTHTVYMYTCIYI